MTTNEQSGWLDILRADIAATGSINKTAQRVGVSRPALSQILNGSGPYGSGKASTARVEEKVMNTIGLVACPFLSTYHGEEHRITGLQCREYAYRVNPPTNIPREMQHWRACQGCDKRVKPAGIIAAPVALKPVRKIGKIGPVKNEIYEQAEDLTKPGVTLASVDKASSCGEAHHEGWNCTGGPQDNPYAVDDPRRDHWDNGHNARRVADLKQRQRIRETDDTQQQAGVIDTRTLPLPVVGGPQILEGALE